MMDNQCVNIFSTYATIYGSHTVKFAFIERENIFLFVYPQLNFFLNQVCVFLFFPTSKIFPKIIFPKTCFVFPIFIGGEKFFFNICCSQGELLIFIGGVASIFYRVELFFVPLVLFFLSSLLSLYSLFELSLSIRYKKGGEIGEMWESFFFVQAEIKLFFKGGEYKNFLMYLTQRESQNLFIFIMFHIIVYMSFFPHMR